MHVLYGLRVVRMRCGCAAVVLLVGVCAILSGLAIQLRNGLTSPLPGFVKVLCVYCVNYAGLLDMLSHR